MIPSGFDPAPSVGRVRDVVVSVVERAPGDVGAFGYPVGEEGDVPAGLRLDRAALATAGFDGTPGQTHVVASSGGPLRVAVGVGDRRTVDAAAIRDAAAGFALAARRQGKLAAMIPTLRRVDPATAAQVIVEGVLLARYAYEPLKGAAGTTPVESISIVAESGDLDAMRRGAERGRALAGATLLARDLANAPPSHLTAARLADVAEALGPDRGLEVETFDRDALVELGCGGLLGVNGGSVDEPRMIRLTYRPTARAGEGAAPRLAVVAKGIMYDSGGISLKPSDAVHATMKNDMSGAAAVLAAMTILRELDCPTEVTGYLMCTDNVPSGSALKLGDVITMRGGTTVEVLNTDDEGRLVMADALVLATEARPDAIVDIATLTGASMRALGTSIGGVIGNDQGLVEQVRAASEKTDEPTWQLPLERRYRRQLDSEIADLTNMGGPNAGAITAALFLEAFVGDVPWAHVDIAGVAQADPVESWRVKGCTGFGARLLVEFALAFAPTG
jgi:leucyl aminopeptidase